MVVRQLQDIIMDTARISRDGSQRTSQNTAYKEVVALFVLAHIEGPGRAKFFEGYRENQ